MPDSNIERPGDCADATGTPPSESGLSDRPAAPSAGKAALPRVAGMPCVGDRLESFEVLDTLGAGGMGEVYRARDERLGRDVALKFLFARLATDPMAVERFIREARAASALNHPNIVTIYEIGESDAGRFIAMELIEGRTLRALFATGRPAPATVVSLGQQVARALAVAHAAGIVHRDVKPGNLIVTPDRRIKITDFGIARATEGMALTQTGQVMGTPQYLSPEQAQGGRATPASDVY